MEKIQITQDVLRQYLDEHNINYAGIAQEMGANATFVAACFSKAPDRNGKPRCFTGQTLPRLNEALDSFAQKMRQSLITFGSDQTFTNRLGNTYDPGTLPAIKQLSLFFNLTAFCWRVLRWKESKKNATLSAPLSKAYGRISKDVVNRINTELLAIAGVLSNYEVVPADDVKPSDASAPTTDDEHPGYTDVELDVYEEQLLMSEE